MNLGAYHSGSATAYDDNVTLLYCPTPSCYKLDTYIRRGDHTIVKNKKIMIPVHERRLVPSPRHSELRGRH